MPRCHPHGRKRTPPASSPTSISSWGEGRQRNGKGGEGKAGGREIRGRRGGRDDRDDYEIGRKETKLRREESGKEATKGREKRKKESQE